MTKEEILALAGKPVAWKDTCFTSDENDQQSTDIVLLGYEGIDSLPDGTDLFTADQLLVVVKPLEDEIAELKQQRDGLLKAITPLRNAYIRLVQAIDEHEQNEVEDMIEITDADAAIDAAKGGE